MCFSFHHSIYFLNDFFISSVLPVDLITFGSKRNHSTHTAIESHRIISIAKWLSIFFLSLPKKAQLFCFVRLLSTKNQYEMIRTTFDIYNNNKIINCDLAIFSQPKKKFKYSYYTINKSHTQPRMHHQTITVYVKTYIDFQHFFLQKK